MKAWPFLTLVLLSVSASPVYAQPAAAKRVRVAGTVLRLTGNLLVVSEQGGGTADVHLSPTAKIFGIEKRQLSDVKPGDFVASGGVRGNDGKIHAVEVRIFPQSLRGLGEGQRPWSVKPRGVMTNATVGTVTQTPAGGAIHVTFEGRQSEYLVGPQVPVLAYVAGDRSLLKPGAAITTVARKMPDGSLEANLVAAEKNGVKPPM